MFTHWHPNRCCSAIASKTPSTGRCGRTSDWTRLRIQLHDRATLGDVYFGRNDWLRGRLVCRNRVRAQAGPQPYADRRPTSGAVMLDVTTFGIIAGAVIGLPLLLFARIVGGTMPIELIDPPGGG